MIIRYSDGLISISDLIKVGDLPSQVNPSPVHPVLHEQLYDPVLFMQVAFLWQLFNAGSEHSLISEMKSDSWKVIG